MSNDASVIFDPTEQELGIRVYLSPHMNGFTAVLKARYSDFVVHEVALDGTIAKLTTYETKRTDTSSAVATTNNTLPENDSNGSDNTNNKRKRDTEKDAETLDWPRLEQELSDFVGADAARSACVFLQAPISNDTAITAATTTATTATDEQQQQYIALPPLAEKDDRRQLHAWIRSHLSQVARADTTEKTIRVWHVRYERNMPNYKERNNNLQQLFRAPLPKDKPFLRFVLYKENLDTASALNSLQRRFGNNSGGRGGGRGGRCGRGDAPLRMGYAGMKDKRGVTSQFVTVPASTNLAKLASINKSGGGGGHTRNQGRDVLRVGNFEYVAVELRLGRLRGNRFDIALRNVQLDGLSVEAMKTKLASAAEALRQHGFINYFGVQRFGKYHDTHLTGMAVLKGDYEKAIDIIMSIKPDERPETVAARQEWLDRFAGSTADDDRAKLERDCAARVVPKLGRFMNCEVAVLSSLAKSPLDYKRAYSCIAKTMRMMFIHAVQSYLWNLAVSWRIEKLGRQVVKGDLALVCNDSDDKFAAVHVVSDDDIAASRYKLEEIVFPLVGTKTRDPENEAGAVFDAVLKKHDLTRKMFEIEDKSFDMAGDYRNIVCHSADFDFEIIEYADSHEPLLQTDLMALEGIDVRKKVEAGESTLLAMNVGFTLPSSTYATIALRELMKRPTSGDFQGALLLDNRETPTEPQVDIVAH
jgi:tRNA pseudouridine13 synthase